jgi:hypothetical protein
MSRGMSDPIQWHTSGVARQAIVAAHPVVEFQLWGLLSTPSNVIFNAFRVAVKRQVKEDMMKDEHV